MKLFHGNNWIDDDIYDDCLCVLSFGDAGNSQARIGMTVL